VANAKYNPFLEQLGAKAVSMTADVWKCSLIDLADYTFSAAHNEYSGGARDVPLAAIVSESAALTSLTFTSGAFDSADFSFTTVTGDQSEALILWDDTITNDLPAVFYDTGMTGMPVTPNGGNINVTLGANWFAL
jgi:hypothetical protein